MQSTEETPAEESGNVMRGGIFSRTIVHTYATGVCPLEFFSGLTVLTPCQMSASDLRRPSPGSNVIGIKFVSSRRRHGFGCRFVAADKANQKYEEKNVKYRRSMPPHRA